MHVSAPASMLNRDVCWKTYVFWTLSILCLKIQKNSWCFGKPFFGTVHWCLKTCMCWCQGTAFAGSSSPACFSRADPNGWNDPVWLTKSYSPDSSCLKSQAKILQISSLVSSVTWGVPRMAMACLVFQESPRTHPLLQLQTVAVLPARNLIHPQALNLG